MFYISWEEVIQCTYIQQYYSFLVTCFIYDYVTNLSILDNISPLRSILALLIFLSNCLVFFKNLFLYFWSSWSLYFMCVFYKWYITEFRASLVAQLVKNPPEMQETWVQFLGWEDPLEKGTATHSSILAWRSPWIVWSMGSQRVRHNWVTFAYTFNFYNHCLLIDEFSSFTLMKWRNRFNYFHLISCHWLSLPFYPFLGFCCSVTKLCPTLCDPTDWIPQSMEFSRPEYWSG